MNQKLFITATNTNIGKTYAACALLEHFGKQGVSIGAVKPIETGVINIPQDAEKLLRICKKYNKNFRKLTPFDITSYTFPLPAAPYSADSKKIIDIVRIKEKVEEISKLCDLLIIEGAGGLYVPVKKDYFIIDLIKELKTEALLITPSHLGCINETLLSIKALEEYNIPYNWCVNIYKEQEQFQKQSQKFYDNYFKNWYSLEEFITLPVFR